MSLSSQAKKSISFPRELRRSVSLRNISSGSTCVFFTRHLTCISLPFAQIFLYRLTAFLLHLVLSPYNTDSRRGVTLFTFWSDKCFLTYHSPLASSFTPCFHVILITQCISNHGAACHFQTSGKTRIYLFFERPYSIVSTSSLSSLLPMSLQSTSLLSTSLLHRPYFSFTLD